MNSAVNPQDIHSPPDPPERNHDLLISVSAVVSKDLPQLEERVDQMLAVLSRTYDFYELLLVDNGTPVDVHDRLVLIPKKSSNVRLLRLSRTYSREVAIAAALDHCIGDYVVVMDLATDPVDLVPPLVARAANGFDAVIAENEEKPKVFLEKALVEPVYRIASRLLGFALRSDESYFRVFSRRLVNSIIRIRSRNRYLSCLNGVVGFHQCAVVYQQEGFAEGNHSVRRLFRTLAVASDILVSNSAAPLRFAAVIGLFASFANAAYLVYVLLVSLIKERVAEGWITTSLTQTTMFLMLFLILSILSEYIARILDETKAQPLYFVEFETHSSVAVEGRSRLNIA